LSLVLLAALSLLLIASPPAAERLRHVVFDGYQRIFPLPRNSAPVVIVAIDERSLAQLGQWPWPRTRIAELIERISAHEPAAIGIDIFFSEPDRFSPASLAREIPGLSPEAAAHLEALPSNDERLAQAMRGQRVVLGIAGASAVDPRFPNPPRNPPVALPGDRELALVSYAGHLGHIPVIDAAAESHGLISSGQEGQVVRVIPMIARVQGVEVPSLGVETVRAASDQGLRISAADWGLLTLRIEHLMSKVQGDGTAWLRMGPHDEDRFVSAASIISGKVDPDAIRKKIVLVGMTGLGLLDFKTSPLGEQVPGVEIHAQVVENLFNDVSLTRPAFAPRIEAGVLVLCGFILIAFMPRMSALKGINLAAGLVVLLLAGGVLAFLYGNVLIDPAWPAIGTTAMFLSVVVGTLSVAERQRRQLREQAAHMAGEVDAARRIQMGLLPDPRETVGSDRRFSIAALLEPARTVGGDFYDCFKIDERRVFFVVADVSGKGLPAALFMASAKSHLKSAALRGGQVGEILSRAQDEIQRENPEQLFVTMFAAILDVATGELEFSNAGHELPFMRRPDGPPERFGQSGGPPLCVIDGYEYPTWKLSFAPGEWLCVVTDGATEAMNPKREFFTVDRLRTSLTWMTGDIQPEEVIRRLRDDVARFTAGAEPADDLTLLALRWDGEYRGQTPISEPNEYEGQTPVSGTAATDMGV
jgi:serine phosphatase RsbU (regulator of sigma subunit)/CHASE2 domain-containing sensor protein